MTDIGEKTRSDVLLGIIETQTEIAKLGLDLGGVMAMVVDRVQDLTAADGAIVELAEGDEMVYRAAAGMAKPQLGLRLARQSSLSGLCVESGDILICTDSESDLRVDREACRRVGLRSMVVSPLKHKDEVVGVIKLASEQVNAFTDEDVRVLSLMSNLIAAAMYHAARFETSELYHRATHDALTGLANRSLFFDRLRQCLAHASRHDGRIGVLNLDMDGLKPINDRMGHRAGDAAIREIARRISDASRETDTVARLGGDEFGIILDQISDRSGAERQVRRIAEKIRQPFAFEERDLKLDASIGFAIFPDDAKELEPLIDQADQAMYRVKRARKAEGAPTSPELA